MIKRAKLRKEPQIGLDFQREEALQNININRRLCNLALSLHDGTRAAKQSG